MISTNLSDHVNKTVKSWLGLHADSEIDVTLPDDLKTELYGSEEFSNPHRDQWGNWEHSFLTRYHKGQLWTPTINHWVHSRRKALEAAGVRLEPLWPEPYQSAVCLTHDVDSTHPRLTLRQSLRQFSRLGKLSDICFSNHRSMLMQSARAASDLVKSFIPIPNGSDLFEKIALLEKKYDAVSSFFFAVSPLVARSCYDPHYSMDDTISYAGSEMSLNALCKDLKGEGFDVGLHGTIFTATEWLELAHQKVALENKVGFDVVTSRQHWLKWDCRTTPYLLAKAGIQADSTLGFNRNVGFRNAVAYPFFMFDIESDESIDLLEVPLAIQEGALWSTNGLELSMEMSETVVLSLLDQISETHGCASVLFHPDRFSDPKVMTFYEWLLHECSNRSTWMTSLYNINNWWRNRNRKLNLDF